MLIFPNKLYGIFFCHQPKRGGFFGGKKSGGFQGDPPGLGGKLRRDGPFFSASVQEFLGEPAPGVVIQGLEEALSQASTIEHDLSQRRALDRAR